MIWASLLLLTRVLSALVVGTQVVGVQGQGFFPNGGCKSRSCISTPLAAAGPVATVDGFCFTMFARPCFDMPGGNCCATLTNLFQKIVLQARPECNRQVRSVTVDGAVKGGGIYWEDYGVGLSELRITNLQTNASMADGMVVCLSFLNASACSDPDVFFPSTQHYYSIYDVSHNVCCPTCAMTPVARPFGSPAAMPPPSSPAITSPPPHPLSPSGTPPPHPLSPSTTPPPPPPSSPAIMPPRWPVAVSPLPPPPTHSPSSRCNTLQFGRTCGLPLGKNCPWAFPGTVPAFYRLVASALEPGADRRMFTVVQDKTLDFAAWALGPHPTTPTVNPISQIIFPFPLPAYAALVEATNSTQLRTFVALVASKPSTVSVIPGSIPAVQAVGVNGLLLSTRAGNVYGVTGYYLYKSQNAAYADGDAFYLPEAVVALMPRLGDGSTVEFSFYGSEAYCLIQNFSLSAMNP